MKLFKKLCWLFLLVAIHASAQDIEMPEQSAKEELYEKMLVTDFKKVNENSRISSGATNNVHITQIGNYNKSSLNVKSEQSEVVFNQIGDHNFIDFTVNAKTVNANITQRGNNHKAFEFINSPKDDVSLQLQQTGE